MSASTFQGIFTLDVSHVGFLFESELQNPERPLGLEVDRLQMNPSGNQMVP